MSVFKIAWRTIQFRGLGSVLTVLSMALGVMMVVLVITIHGVVEQSFKSNSSFGYNLIVGSRGGSLQLTANTVFYLSKPVENIPYEFYLAFKDADVRAEELKNSYAAQAASSQDISQQLNGAMLTMMDFGMGSATLTNALIADAESRALYHQMEMDEEGLLKPYTDAAVPICMGDYLNERFRACATTPEFFTELLIDVDTEEKFETSEGRFFQTNTKENGFFEAVLGSAVAKDTNIKIGDIINPIHGAPDSPGAHTHEQGFKVVGILKRTGTPHDRVAFVNMEGFFLMEGHANIAEIDPYDVEPEEDEENGDDEDWFDKGKNENGDPSNNSSTALSRAITTVSFDSIDQNEADSIWAKRVATNSNPLPIEEREVTAILVRSARFEGFSLGDQLAGAIGEGRLLKTLPWSDFRDSEAQTSAQAVNPISEIVGLFDTLVNPIRYVLLALTFMIVVVSAISILVGIYSSMAQRKRDIAIMRALGAGRDTVTSVMFFETVILTMTGALMGVFSAHLVMQFASPIVESRTGVAVGFFDIAPPIMEVAKATGFSRNVLNFLLSGEVVFVAGLFFLALFVGVYPAYTAYRTDVSRSLTE